MTDRETRLNELAEKYLPTEMCERFRARADVYDRENRFFDEDLEELKAQGYLTLFVPESHGGPEPVRGLTAAAASGLRGPGHGPGDQYASHVHGCRQGDE